MQRSLDESFHSVMDGSQRGVAAAALRLAASCAASIYGVGMRTRNMLYDLGLRPSRRLGKSAISVGNITLGGTGKTPVVAWLAAQMTAAGKKPAILLRGYKSDGQGMNDEQAVLKSATDLPVIANPDRIHGAADALRDHPDIGMFILDDAMQHRRAWRDFDLVLIHAAYPFGYDRIFPRGMLREPIEGLKRANSLLITHSSEVPEAEVRKIETRIRQHTAAPVFRSDHSITGFLSAAGQPLSRDDLRERPLFAFCGIGSPDSFLFGLKIAGTQVVGVHKFADHYAYTAQDLANLRQAAEKASASALVTTEKDWTKLTTLNADNASMPLFRARLELKFWSDHEARLLEAIQKTLFP